MLTNEIMGLLALGILWVNTLLVAGATWQQIRALLQRRAALSDGLVTARVGRGEGGALAVHRIEQVGRAAEGQEVILFHDRRAAGEVLGGVLELDGEGGTLVLAPQAEAEVWVTADEIARAARCPSAPAFAEAFAAARKARGVTRTIAVEIAAGQRVFVHGRVEERDGVRTLVPPASGRQTPGPAGLLVATMDPRALLARRAALAAAFIGGAVMLATACTAVALWPPVFGRVSTVGGALCLLFFLLVQPAGTALRDAVLIPSRAVTRGAWKRPAGDGATGDVARTLYAE